MDVVANATTGARQFAAAVFWMSAAETIAYLEPVWRKGALLIPAS